MVCNDLLVGKGRPEVGPSRLEAMLCNDLLVGKGRPEVGPSRPEANSVTGVRKSYTCYEVS